MLGCIALLNTVFYPRCLYQVPFVSGNDDSTASVNSTIVTTLRRDRLRIGKVLLTHSDGTHLLRYTTKWIQPYIIVRSGLSVISRGQPPIMISAESSGTQDAVFFSV